MGRYEQLLNDAEVMASHSDANGLSSEFYMGVCWADEHLPIIEHRLTVDTFIENGYEEMPNSMLIKDGVRAIPMNVAFTILHGSNQYTARGIEDANIFLTLCGERRLVW